MLSSYRIHQEQLKRVEQGLRAPYQRRSAGTGLSLGLVVQDKRPVPCSTRKNQRRKTTGVLTLENEESVVRCSQCNARIPEMDFLYTNKSGLCIPCWEAQEA